MGARMRPTLGALFLLRVLAEGPATKDHLLNALQDELGVRKDERTLRRYLAVLKEAGFEISRSRGRYELRSSPVRLAFTNHEVLATLNVVESLAERDPVYGEYLASASLKLREALPKETVRFADSGRVEFDLSFANDPPENSEVLETLRRATHRNQKAEIYYYSLASGSWSSRTVEPDLIEEFRGSVVDRAVLGALGTGFKVGMAGEKLDEKTRKLTAEKVCERLAARVKHRGHKHSLESVIHIQARSVARFVRDGIPYKPFVGSW